MKSVPVGTSKNSSRQLLDAAYDQLEFDKGILLPASKKPDREKPEEWVEKGDWQALAEDVRAEKIFFVDRDPVAVFAELKATDEATVREFYNRVWSMARPQFLFLSRPGELSLYDLGKPPIGQNERPEEKNRLLARAQTLAEVQQNLANYHRERLETGAVFGEEHFGKGIDRADRALIRDLKKVRSALSAIPLRERANISKTRKIELLHSLIGRAIFIRYLEDRKIITREYFEKVIEIHGASDREDWTKKLDQPMERPDFHPAAENLFFPRVLTSKSFTYALFDQLAHDFNGDTFPVESDERGSFLQAHLNKLRDFLLGNSDGNQLFFQAYRFDIIPIELISAIYEEFYNEEVSDDGNQGSHYTPPSLVEFVLANTLTSDVLKKNPRVLDPACGSGIFLVESFRRIVRFHCAEKELARPTRQDLRSILQRQIAGIDINEEAVRVAAFSLYLAFLHYQKPREILPDQRAQSVSTRLPYLKWVSDSEKKMRLEQKGEAEFFDILLSASAFDPVMGRCESAVNIGFGPNCADVIVGNPPWGDPPAKTQIENEAAVNLKKWCSPENGRPLGDKERSQAFIYLALSLLREGGKAGLLVSSGIFFKNHQYSRAFRKMWLNAITLQQVVNFAHVRRLFFSWSDRKTKGIAPFASIVFRKIPLHTSMNNKFEYWSAKRTPTVENLRSVVMTRGDLHYLDQHECLAYEKLWKIFWWGGRRDELLIRSIEGFPSLLDYLEKRIPGKKRVGGGYKDGDKYDSDWLEGWSAFPAKNFHRYGPLDSKLFYKVGKRVERRGVKDAYQGRRLLLKEGFAKPGHIVARLEHRKFSFTDTGIAVRLDGLEPWKEKIVLGAFWSSLARYYFFLTLGSWGAWHDKFLEQDVPTLPIVFPSDPTIRNRIVCIVDELQTLKVSDGFRTLASRTANSMQGELFSPDQPAVKSSVAEARRNLLMEQLDNAFFDLYALDQPEREIIVEFCQIGLDFFYRGHKSDAVAPVIRPLRTSGSYSDVANANESLSAYLRIFLEWWNAEIGEVGEFAWRIISPSSNAPLLAIIFESRFKHNASAPFDTSDQEAWNDVLKKLAKHTHLPMGSSKIFTDTFFRVVTDREILIVKRNERRFWTKTAAREDAEASMVKAVVLQKEGRRPK